MKKSVPGRVFMYIVIASLVGCVMHSWYLGKTVYGDGIFYYSWLRSIVIDRDINFTNEYKHFGVSAPVAPAGFPGNKYSIGPAILWAPTFMMVHQLVAGDGYALPYQITVGVTSVLFTFFGLILLYRLLDGSDTDKLLTIVVLAWATNLLFYGSFDTVNSHGLSFFAACLFLSFALASKRNWIAIGASLGLLAAIRLQDVSYILILLPYWRSVNLKHFIFGLLYAFSPQLIAWHLLYGNFWTNPYLAGGESFALLHPHILGVLFSKENGLILWTPIVLLGVVGLFIKKATYWPYILVFLAELLLVASWSTWWQGESFSGRMFASSLPLIAFGLLPGIAWLRRTYGSLVTALFITAFGMLNVLAIFYFLLVH